MIKFDKKSMIDLSNQLAYERRRAYRLEKRLEEVEQRLGISTIPRETIIKNKIANGGKIIDVSDCGILEIIIKIIKAKPGDVIWIDENNYHIKK